MNKNEFINIMKYEDINVLSNLYDKMILASKINKKIFTSEFYPPCIWKKIDSVSKFFKICSHSYGVFSEADRRMISFNNDYNLDYPVNLLKITCNSKFTNFEHKDYLGSIMSLGIKREKIGDIIVKDNVAYCVTSGTINEYIVENLVYIKKSPCNIEILDTNLGLVLKNNFKEFTITISSSRLDCVVGAIIGQSRNVAVDLIKSGKVLVDYSKVIDKSETVDFKTVITIKKNGKFIFEKEIGRTQKGKIKILIKKYN